MKEEDGDITTKTWNVVDRYNPYLQTRHRVEQLKQLGHSVDKVEFIVMGGTFMALADDYRDFFIRNLHDALSGHTSANVDEVPFAFFHLIGSWRCFPGVAISCTVFFLDFMLLSLALGFFFYQAVRYSERSRTKCIGITIETRPDYCLKRHQSDMLRYGCTRLEIGVQSIYEVKPDFHWRDRGHVPGLPISCTVFLFPRVAPRNL